MNEVNDLFFELLQVAIGNRDMLTHAPSAEEWEEVYEVCKKQSVTGIAFAGVERLPQEQMPPGRRIRQWAVKADKIRERNAKVSRECVQVSKFFEKNGFDSVILKGQGNYAYYPEHLQGLRGAGDIDVWVRPKGKIDGNGNVNWNCNKDNLDNQDNFELARSAFEPASATSDLNSEASAEVLNQREARLEHPVRAVVEFCLSVKKGEYVYYHNMDFPILKDTAVEVHYRPTWLYNPFRNRALQRWFGQFTVHNSQFTVHNSQFAVYDGYRIPSVEFDVVFQLLHLYKHIFEEGIGLRQLLDYYFVINNVNLNVNANFGPVKRLELIKTLGLEGFAGAVMYVMHEVFGMTEAMMLWKPDKRRGRKLLGEIMRGGNFGKYDDRYNWAETTNGSMEYRGVSYAFARLRHNMAFLWQYPSEVLWEPVFRVYHWVWRRFKLWKFE